MSLKLKIKSNTELPSGKAVESNSQTQKLKKLKKAAQQFEAVFLSQVLKSMRQTVPEGGLLQRGLANEIYESMFDEEISMKMAEGQTRSFADMIFRQLAGKLNNGTPIEEILHGVDDLKKEKGTKTPVELPDGVRNLIDRASLQNSIRRPEEAPSAGTKFLKQITNHFDNDLELALSAFGAGSLNLLGLEGAPSSKEIRDYVNKMTETYTAIKTGNMADHHRGEGGHDG